MHTLASITVQLVNERDAYQAEIAKLQHHMTVLGDRELDLAQSDLAALHETLAQRDADLADLLRRVSAAPLRASHCQIHGRNHRMQ